MSKGVNKVILIGRLGQDPEVKYMPSGGAVTNISVATSESWKDKNTGVQQVRTEWHKVVFFNKLGEIAGEYLKKGSKVYIEGSLRTRKWQAQDGTDRFTTEIVASEMQMQDGKNDLAPDASQQSYAKVQQQGYRGHTGSNQPNPTSAPAQQSPAGFGGQWPDDDINF